ncbi:hypothetical protein HAX54_026146 [Datura stramonium]|uniref:Uncharacterized protein n=1 Tax=Datura stramonium TaxID=4076 RepID=A0ABS8V1H6_DATST|nr:hypothetical protein [Datura stramonium]
MEVHLVAKLIDVAKVKEPDTMSELAHIQAEHQPQIGRKLETEVEIDILEEWYLLIKSVMLMCQVGLAFVESLEYDEPIVLTYEVDKEDDEDDATTSAMMVADTEDVDDQDFSPIDDDNAKRLKKFFLSPFVMKCLSIGDNANI